MDELHFSSLPNIFIFLYVFILKVFSIVLSFPNAFWPSELLKRKGVLHTELQQEHKAAQENGANEHFKTSPVVKGSTVNRKCMLSMSVW